MKCRVCGSNLIEITTDLPFKVTKRTIVIVKGLPVLQCERCAEYTLDDATMARVDELLSRADTAAELEVVRFAA